MTPRLLKISNILKDSGSAFLFGARGTGKTYLAREWIKTKKHSFSVDLLDFDLFQRYLSDPSILKLEIESKIKENKGILAVFIDEIQNQVQIILAF